MFFRYPACSPHYLSPILFYLWKSSAILPCEALLPVITFRDSISTECNHPFFEERSPYGFQMSHYFQLVIDIGELMRYAIYTYKSIRVLLPITMDRPISKNRRPTQADVARIAGVSQAMVSYVLNDNPAVSISAETRRRILEAVASLGYVPNAPARSLRTNRTYTIASIIPDVTNPFYPALERGIQDVADQHDYDLIIYNTDGLSQREEKCLRSVQQGRVDGIIGVFFHTSASDLISLLDRNIAVVRLEASPKKTGERPLDNVYVDNIKAAKAGVLYLLQKGYKRIGMLTGGIGPGQPRLFGYREAHAELGQKVDERLVFETDFTEAGGQTGMQALLGGEILPDAVFAANDMMAMGALVALRDAGYRVPEDIAVMGFDNIPTAKLVSPPLTTVGQSQNQMGRRAAEMLFERLNGQSTLPGRCEELPFELIVRESA